MTTVHQIQRLSEAGLDSRMTRSGGPNRKTLLIKPPYFTPWTPPLGIAILKTFIEKHGFGAKCIDLNVEPDLWGMHHKYFATLQSLEDVSLNDGYSKLWWILNAHMLARANGAGHEPCGRVLRAVIPTYGIRCDEKVIRALIPLVDGFYKRLEELIDRIDLAEYSFVGTSTYTTSLGPSLFLLKKVKEKHPNIKTVMGGGVFADDLAMGSDNLKTLLEEYPYIDHVLIGEGELLLLKLLQGEIADKRLISLGDLSGATLPMNQVPIPDFSDLDLDLYYHLSIEGARSCPFQCSFCSETIQWGEYRKKPIAQLADQMVTLSEKYENPGFFMGDSLMNPYINPLAENLVGRGAKIQYDGYLRADRPVSNSRFVKLWAESGLFRVRLGIESASAHVLEEMNKKTTPAVISEALRALASRGIRTTTYWIAGFPGETEEDFKETCEFIRKHHRWIYELEAHPYYYYPYGQPASRLHECYSLYPDEVSEVIKFKVWEPLDIRPDRMERYRRLREMTAMAADLGLPNIYSMAERYQAEDRWRSLHPLASNVYDGPNRANPRQKLSLVGAGGEERFGERSDAGSVYRYRVLLRESLDTAILARAIEIVILYNEILLVDFVKEESAFEGDLAASVLEVVHCYDQTDERQLINRLVEPMRREGALLKVLLMDMGGAEQVLLLLVNKNIADPRSVILLVEEIFRAYRQLAESNQLYLSPIRKTCSDLISEASAENSFGRRLANLFVERREPPNNNDGAGRRTFARSGSRSTRIPVPEHLTRELSIECLKNLELTAQELFIAAILVFLEKAGDAIAVYTTRDQRESDEETHETVGPLTGVYSLPLDIKRESSLLTTLENVKRAVRDSALLYIAVEQERHNGWPPEHGQRILLDMRRFIDEPWFDDPRWIPDGFVNEDVMGETDFVTIAPVISKNEVEIWLDYSDEPLVCEIADTIRMNFLRAVEAILEEQKRYWMAREFWIGEWTSLKESPIWVERGETALGSEALSRHFCEFDVEGITRVEAACGVELSSLLLSSFLLLLSRVSGSESVTIVTSLGPVDSGQLLPLRFNIPSSRQFVELARDVAAKVSTAAKHMVFASRVIARDFPRLGSGNDTSLMDVGYRFCDATSVAASTSVEELLRSCHRDHTALLVLHGCKCVGRIAIAFECDREVFSETVINKLCDYLSAIIAAIIDDTTITVEEIPLEIEAQATLSFEDPDAGESFAF